MAIRGVSYRIGFPTLAAWAVHPVSVQILAPGFLHMVILAPSVLSGLRPGILCGGG